MITYKNRIKYKVLRTDSITIDGIMCYRVVACKDFGDVKAGDLGGYIADTAIMSQRGLCWVYDGSVLGGGSHLFGDAKVSGNSELINCVAYDNVIIHNTEVQGGDETSIIKGAAYVCESMIGSSVIIADQVEIYCSQIAHNSIIRMDAKVYTSQIGSNVSLTGSVIVNQSTVGVSLGGCTTVIGSTVNDKYVLPKTVHIRNSNLHGGGLVFDTCERIYNYESTDTNVLFEKDICE